MDATGQIFQISKFSDTLSFAIIPECFGEVWRKSDKSINTIKIGQSGCIPPKIEYEILAHKGSQTTRATPVRLSRLLKLRTNGTAAMTMNLDFPGKVTHCSYDQGSDEEDDTIMSKVAKGKGKTLGKNAKIGKCAEERDNESTDSSNPNYD